MKILAAAFNISGTLLEIVNSVKYSDNKNEFISDNNDYKNIQIIIGSQFIDNTSYGSGIKIMREKNDFSISRIDDSSKTIWKKNSYHKGAHVGKILGKILTKIDTFSIITYGMDISYELEQPDIMLMAILSSYFYKNWERVEKDKYLDDWNQKDITTDKGNRRSLNWYAGLGMMHFWPNFNENLNENSKNDLNILNQLRSWIDIFSYSKIEKDVNNLY